MNTYSFSGTKAQELKAIKDSAALQFLFQKYVANFSHYTQATSEEDRKGVDLWVHKSDGTKKGVDIKSMGKHYVKGDSPVLPLETWSILPEDGRSGRIGWTRDYNKITDIVLWYWPNEGDYVIVPFRSLRDWFSKNWMDLRKTHKVSQQYSTKNSNNWGSECVFVEAKYVLEQLQMPVGMKCWGNLKLST